MAQGTVLLRAKSQQCKGGRKQCLSFSHEKKTALLSMKYWLVNRDPYKGLLLLLSLYNWVV